MDEQEERGRKLESKIQADLICYLRARGWHVERMLADSYQNGIPDLYCFHKQWGHRWIEVKRPVGYSLTLRQRQKFPAWEEAGIGIWILTAATEEQYRLLFTEPNWRDFWKPKDAIPDAAAMFDELADEYERSRAAERGS
jgi:hypothetical protein